MRMDFGFILGHLFEYLLFIYYANTSFIPKVSNIKRNLIALCGYIVLFALGLLGYPFVSIIAFSVVNSILLAWFYEIRIRGAIFYSLILNMLSIVGEYIFLYIMEIDYFAVSIQMSPRQSFVMTIGGKLFYLIGVLFLKRFFQKKSTINNDSLFVLIGIPLVTIICITALMLTDMNYMLFYLVCVSLILINIMAIIINDSISRKNAELQALQEEYNQNKSELAEYQILAEKYENTQIMQHDIRKHFHVLYELMDTDNVQARQYLKQMEYTQQESNYVQYTDNKILNILIAQKIKEAHEHHVDIHIHSSNPPLDFISEIDTVAVFSNLLDNAIEASKDSNEKVIFVDFYLLNHSYTAVKIENSADKKPIILDGSLRTYKKGAERHGIGVKSINRSLKKYNSKLEWSYDSENKLFRTLILIQLTS